MALSGAHMLEHAGNTIVRFFCVSFFYARLWSYSEAGTGRCVVRVKSFLCADHECSNSFELVDGGDYDLPRTHAARVYHNDFNVFSCSPVQMRASVFLEHATCVESVCNR